MVADDTEGARSERIDGRAQSSGRINQRIRRQSISMAHLNYGSEGTKLELRSSLTALSPGK